MQFPLQLRFKVLALATQIYVTDASGATVFYVKQKMFKLKEDIAVFGRVTERTQNMMAVTHTYTPETWDVVDESRSGIRLRRRPGATKGVAVGKVVGVKLGEAATLQLGMVRSLTDEGEGLVATVTLFPGTPEPAAVRGAKVPWSQGFALPAIEKLGVPASLVVPVPMAYRGRPVYFWKDGAVGARVQDVTERGIDFARVTLSQAP